MACIKLDERHCLHWGYQCLNRVKMALADKTEIWTSDAKYRYAQETFATDLAKKKL